jgi:signal transduction histidine kinase
MAEVHRTGSWDGQVQRRDRDGRDVFLVSHLVLYREGDTDESLIVEVNSDIGPLVEAEREQHRLVNELHRAERLDALGQLAGGIAHDFGNLLTVMIDNLTAIGASLTEGSQAESDLAEARRIAERAEALTQQLMVFARNEEGLAVPVEVDALVFDLATMLGRLVGDHIDFLLELTSGRASVMADPSRLEQVVMNMVLNARDALPYGGHVRAVTAVTEVTADDSRGLEPGEYVRLTVSDDGVGMSSEDVERAFDPLFTTKISGKGTGFGLSTVLGVVSSYGGTAEIESEPNVGTSVSVWLPRVSGVAGGGGANA